MKRWTSLNSWNLVAHPGIQKTKINIANYLITRQMPILNTKSHF